MWLRIGTSGSLFQCGSEPSSTIKEFLDYLNDYLTFLRMSLLHGVS